MARAALRSGSIDRADPGPLLAARRLRLAYGHLRVLDGIDFEVWPGQFVAVTGENGAGKSTLVRCLAGDLAPDSGEVVVGGGRIRSNAGAAASGLAVVWQDLALCDNLDVSANLFLGREPGRLLVSDARAAVEARRLLAAYGIKIHHGRSVGSLSSGQRQLVAVARAMRSRPRILILDEPTASLGVHETRQVEDLLAKLKSEGTTILLVSHDVEQVFDLADRILVLHRGRVAADLVPAETHPDDVVAIMSGHQPDATARHQLSRLQNLVDQLASSTPSSTLALIVSALESALVTDQLAVHLLEDGALALAASTGFPPAVVAAFATLPVGSGGGPIGLAAETGRVVVEEDAESSDSWRPFSAVAAAAGVRSSWSVPLVGSTGLIGVITGCQPLVGRPQRDQMDLVSLYAGYAAGAIERDRLFGEVTARNRVLETIREVLETLAGPAPVSTGLLLALQSLQRGLGAEEVELWVQGADGLNRCSALIDGLGLAHPEPLARDGTDAALAFARTPTLGGPHQLSLPERRAVVAATLEAPGGRAALIARWPSPEQADGALALLGDAANSVRLALERDEAEQAHQQAAALLRSNRLQRDFLSRLSHELRTPLTAIRGYASSLLASDVTWDEESKSRFLSRIAGESARLGRLVGDLLDFSAIESDLLRLQPDWCDLGLILEAALACLPADRAAVARLECPVDIGPVWADHDRLEQVFVNLLDNALRHNEAPVSVRVEVSLEGGDGVAVRVADDGKGIPPELRPRLFDAPGAAAKVGLGLSIAAGIVRAHGGEIRLEEAGRGASFLIRLPIEGPGAAAS